MPLLVRRIFFYALLGLFLIVAPILIAYSSGYRYSQTQRRIVKTGALSIETTPNNAQIIINGELHASNTPAFITNIIPGNYEIQIKKEGYHTWSKTLPVKSSETTFIRQTVLSKITEPIFKGPIGDKIVAEKTIETLKQYKISLNKNNNATVIIDNDTRKIVAEINGEKTALKEKDEPLLFVYSDHEVWQFNPKNKEIELITRLAENVKKVIPIPKQDLILIVLDKKIIAIETDRRDNQNTWDIAEFDQIKDAALFNETTIEIFGIYKGQEGIWTLQIN